MSKESVSYQIALESNKFHFDGSYLRPNEDSGIAEYFKHTKDHNLQAYVIQANKPTKKALVIGGSDYPLSQLAECLGVDLTAYNKSVTSSQNGSSAIPLSNLTESQMEYWTQHGVDRKTLDHHGVYWDTKYSKALNRPHPCFVIPVNDISEKYIFANGLSKPKQSSKGSKHSIYPDNFVPSGSELFVMEGFADYFKAWQDGLSACTHMGGVKEIKKLPSILKERLNDPSSTAIIIVIDNDDESRDCKDDIISGFIKAGFPKIKVVDLPKELGKDYCDYRKLCSIEDFKALVDNSPFYSIESKPDPQNNNEDDFILTTESGYYIDKVKSGNQISNFTLAIHKEYSSSKGVEYLVSAKSTNKQSRRFVLPGSSFIDPVGFAKNVASMGMFHYWHGSKRVLAKIAELARVSGQMAEVEILDGYGWFANHGFYAFPDLIIKDGRIYYPDESDEDRVFTINSKSFVVDCPYQGMAPPNLAIKEGIQVGDVSREIVENVSRFIPGGYYGLIMFAWSMATIFSDIFFTRKVLHRAFPFLHIYGGKSCGKTESTQVLRDFFGIIGEKNFDESTGDFFNKSLYSFRNLPVWFDEVSSDSKAKIKPGVVKSAYNRAGVGKGTLTGTRSLDIHGTVILSGEEKIDEIIERSILIPFPDESKRTTLSNTAFQWLRKNTEILPIIAIDLMKRRDQINDSYVEQVLRVVDWLKDNLDRVSDRVAKNYATILGIIPFIPGIDNQYKDITNSRTEFGRWIIDFLSKELEQKDEASVISRVFEYYFTLGPDKAPFHFDSQKEILYISSGELNAILMSIDGKSGINQKRFDTLLKQAPYYMGNRFTHRFEKSTKNCIGINMGKKGIPRVICDQYEIFLGLKN